MLYALLYLCKGLPDRACVCVCGACKCRTASDCICFSVCVCMCRQTAAPEKLDGVVIFNANATKFFRLNAADTVTHTAIHPRIHTHWHQQTASNIYKHTRAHSRPTLSQLFCIEIEMSSAFVPNHWQAPAKRDSYIEGRGRGSV